MKTIPTDTQLGLRTLCPSWDPDRWPTLIGFKQLPDPQVQLPIHRSNGCRRNPINSPLLVISKFAPFRFTCTHTSYNPAGLGFRASSYPSLFHKNSVSWSFDRENILEPNLAFWNRHTPLTFPYFYYLSYIYSRGSQYTTSSQPGNTTLSSTLLSFLSYYQFLVSEPRWNFTSNQKVARFSSLSVLIAVPKRIKSQII
ncbi:hypothetical protein CROQUDRAFT_658059 [Cronartium quercuum f. sp. fusiforme G11]|uniref:Uncharacterized protein n=1 Tax=Cronartium quercuum f. sp. fusiforme G11 TaxID=708437 RepID=A0A9P6NM09_9BASI|nr:hypothetical protein CROQUDRAFT_658059 [Cronartium quercuum f. sp. fusiforme G11]